MVHDSAGCANAGGVPKHGPALGELGPYSLCPTALRENSDLSIRSRAATSRTRTRSPKLVDLAAGTCPRREELLRSEGGTAADRGPLIPLDRCGAYPHLASEGQGSRPTAGSAGFPPRNPRDTWTIESLPAECATNPNLRRLSNELGPSLQRSEVPLYSQPNVPLERRVILVTHRRPQALEVPT